MSCQDTIMCVADSFEQLFQQIEMMYLPKMSATDFVNRLVPFVDDIAEQVRRRLNKTHYAMEGRAAIAKMILDRLLKGSFKSS